MLGKKRVVGRGIDDIKVGEKLVIKETITDKDLLLYLGLTNDNNPLFIQHDYALLTPFNKPIVPQVMITGIILSAISKSLPGPGSYISKQQISFPKPVYHDEKITIMMEVIRVNKETHSITLSIVGKDEKNEEIITGMVDVQPPYPEKSITSNAFENF